jgi:CheY-like chemotaxis protein
MVLCDPLRLRQLFFHLAAVAWQPSEGFAGAPRPHAPRLQVQLADRSCSSSPLSAGAQVLEVVVERDDVHATEAEDLCALLQHGAQDPRALSSWHQQLASIGLALPIASGLVRAMGGCIRVQSLPSPAGRVRLVARLPVRMAPLQRSRGDSCPLLSSPLRPSALASPATFKPNISASRPAAAVVTRRPEAAQPGGIGTMTLHDSPAARSAGSLTATDTASHQPSPSGFPGDQAWADEVDEGRRSDASVPILRLRSSMAPITPATPRKDDRGAPQRPLPRHLLGGRKLAASEGSAPRSTEAPSTPRSSSAAHLHVCIVDDDAVNRRLHERLVRKLGHSVTLCTDGDEVAPAVAQAAATGIPIAGVLLDIMMPRMGGVEACKALRTAGYAGCVIAVTANASPADQERYAQAGFNAVLPKPFTTAQLSRVLSTMLSGCSSAVVPSTGTGSVTLAAESVQLVLPPMPALCVVPAIPVTPAV